MMFVKRIRVTFLMLVVFGTIGMTIFVGKGLETKVSAETDNYKDLKIFSEVLSSIKKSYVESLDTKDLVYGAIKGMLGALDAHSAFMPPEVYKEMQVDTRGEFGGLGLQIGIKDKKLVVVAPIADTPAARAGIKAGDVIHKVDDHQMTENTSLLDAVQKMRGPKGTAVTLTVLRESEPGGLVFTLIRDTIRINSVKSRTIEEGIGYIQITQFQEHTAKDLSKEIETLTDIPIHSLILDLRNNPGGLLNSAVKVSDQFLESGQLIVSIKSRDGNQDEYTASNTSRLSGIPIIVLVNEGSASASEIVSGALQDWKRAVIVGTQTFGKGSVQTILPLSDGSALRLTTAKYYTPNGRSIQNKGIEPDIIVKQEVVQEAKTSPIIREKDLARHLNNEFDPNLEENEVNIELSDEETKTETIDSSNTGGSDVNEDNQLKKAVDLLKGWRIIKALDPVLSANKEMS
ncbi:MAG: S41 family peptidase [Nitrospiria bacterium]